MSEENKQEEPSEELQAQPTSEAAESKAAESKEGGNPHTPNMAPPPVDFKLFIEGFVGQALVALGKIPHPISGKTSVELPWARYFIDILGMLEDKTAGNLDKETASLLESRLTMLRMTYVDMQK